MRVIIPIAGRGTRLLPYTQEKQKCLLPVAGKPVIDHILTPLIEQGFDQITLVTGNLENQVKEHVRRFDASFRFVRQEEALGLGHAVYQALDESHGPVLIQLGDVIYHHDFVRFSDTDNFRMAVDRVPDPERFGIVELEDNHIVRVWEKPQNPPGNIATVGLYYIPDQGILRDALTYLIDHDITTKGEIQLADAFQRILETGVIVTAEYVSRWYDCGVPETFLSTNKALLGHSGLSVAGSVINEPVSIDPDCTIENSTIGPFVTAMKGCHIVNSAVEDAILLWDCEVVNRKVSHAIIGNHHLVP